MLIYLELISTEEERSKFEALYYEYSGLMKHIALKILKNEHDAEDAVDNAFVAVAENIQKVDEAVCPKSRSFVVTIVERKAIDIYRLHKRYKMVELNEDVAGIEFEYDGDNELARHFAALPPRYREILLLKHRHGYTNREVAKILGLTESNVSKLEQRAKAKLAQLYEMEE